MLRGKSVLVTEYATVFNRPNILTSEIDRRKAMCVFVAIATYLPRLFGFNLIVRMRNAVACADTSV
jgi:hypothetical protein